MATFKSDYFKIGDKFDASRFAIIRTEEKDGVEQTSVIKVGIDFLGCTLIPGVGLKSPEPDNLVCLYDGSFLQYDQSGKPIKHLRVTGNNVSEDEIEYDKNGLATIDLNTGANITVSEKNGAIARTDDAGKMKELQGLLLDEKTLAEQEKQSKGIAVEIIETISKSRTPQVIDPESLLDDKPMTHKTTYDDGTIKTTYDHSISFLDEVLSTFLSSEGEGAASSTEKAMFSLRKKEGEKTIETAALIDNGVDKFLYFSPTQEVLDYLTTEAGQKFIAAEKGKNPAIEIVGEGANARYRFKVENCTYKTNGNFEVVSKDGISFQCNGASINLAIGESHFVDRITAKPKRKDAKTVTTKGFDCLIAKELLQKGRKGKDGYSVMTGNGLDILKNPEAVKELFRESGKNNDGIFTCENAELDFISCVLPTSGDKKPVMFAKEKVSGKAYVLHNGQFVELNPEKLHEVTEADPSKGRFKLSPKQKSQGHYVALTYDTQHSPVESGKVDAISRFLGEKGTTVKQVQVQNAHSNEEFSKEISSTYKTITTKYKVTGLEPEKVVEKPLEKKDETTKKTETTETTETKTPAKKGDPKKGNAFWNVISNAMFYAMLFSLIACAFGLGFIALPFAIGFAAAGLVTKGIAYQGGFAANMTEEEYQNALAAAKEKSKDKDLTKAQRKYKERSEEIAKNKAEISKLQEQLDEFDKKGLGSSKEALELKAKIELLNKQNAKLDKKNMKAEKKFSPLESLRLMGKRPEIKDVDMETTRPEFGTNERLYDTMLENLLGQEILTERQGQTMHPIYGQVDFTPQRYMLNAESTSFLNELTPAERLQVWGDVKDLDDKYGGQQNNKFVEIFVEHDMLRQRIASKNFTPEDQKRYDELSKTILTAQKDMGEKMFDEWSNFIRGEARDRYEHIANEYGITDVQTVRSIVKNQQIVERLAGKTDRTPEEETAFQTAREEIESVQRTIGEHSFAIEKEAAIAKARASVTNNAPLNAPIPQEVIEETIAAVERRYSDEKFIEERIAHYGKTYYPKLVIGLDKGGAGVKDKAGNVFNATANPITIRTQLIDEYITARENESVVVDTFDNVIAEDKKVTEFIDTNIKNIQNAVEIGLAAKRELNTKSPLDAYRFNPNDGFERGIIVDGLLFGINKQKPIISDFKVNIPEDIKAKFNEPVEIEDEETEEKDVEFKFEDKIIEKYKKKGIDLFEYVKNQKIIDELSEKPETELSPEEKKLLEDAEKYMYDLGEDLLDEKEIEDIKENTSNPKAVKDIIKKKGKKKLAGIQKDLKKNNLAAHIEELNRISAKYNINAYDLAKAEQTIRTLEGKEKLNKKEQELLAQARATRESIAMKAAETRAFESGFEKFLKRNGIEDGKNVDQKTLEKLKKDYKRKYKQKFDGKEHKVAYGQEVLNEIYVELEENNLLGPQPQKQEKLSASEIDKRIKELKEQTKLNADQQKELANLNKQKEELTHKIVEDLAKKEFDKYLEEYCEKNNIKDKDSVRKKAWEWYKKSIKYKTKKDILMNESVMTNIMDEMKKQGVFANENEDEDVLNEEPVRTDEDVVYGEDEEKDKDKKAKPTSSKPKKKKKEDEREDVAEVKPVYGDGETPAPAPGDYEATGDEVKKDPKKKKQQKKNRPVAGRTSGK